ncbi:hypothetical protein DL770_010564 [Monosporascus sp. CRB-9-2]|nr:hypothetical protein DL770_010564 [Monosporascus sp. CRB-9-2]
MAEITYKYGRLGTQKKKRVQAEDIEVSRNDIRVLLLHPRRGEDFEVRCDLAYLNLSDPHPPPYYALSYCWGKEEPKFPISLNGREHWVRPNLFDALQRLRDRDDVAGRFIWIDALCIDQDDEEEKGSQVDLMGEIYKKASKTFIWLGEHEHASPLAMDLLNSVTEENLRDVLEDKSESKPMEQAWVALRALFGRPYWSRVWILQEVVLSRPSYLICGNSMCPWDSVRLLLRSENFEVDKKNISVGSHHARIALFDGNILPKLLVNIIDCRQTDAQKPEFWDYLVLSRQRNASVAHDYIYGVMALMDPPALRADYKKPVEELYFEVVKHLVCLEKKIGVLSMCCETQAEDKAALNAAAVVGEGPGTSYANSLPSWVPDWRRRFKKDYQSRLLCKLKYSAGIAGPDAQPDIECEPGSRTLRVRGVFVDSVTFVSPAKNLNRWPQVGEDWKTWTQHISESRNMYGSLEEQREAFRSTLQCQYHGSKTRNTDGSDQYFDIAVGRTEGSLVDPKRTFGKAGRQFFGTSNGYMGRGLDEVQAGDIVVVLLGAKVPFVLRECGHNSHYRLVGECYLHGIMNGEVVKDPTKELMDFYLV